MTGFSCWPEVRVQGGDVFCRPGRTVPVIKNTEAGTRNQSGSQLVPSCPGKHVTPVTSGSPRTTTSHDPYKRLSGSRTRSACQNNRLCECMLLPAVCVCVVTELVSPAYF